jgi:methylenetetrahydrofolate dehydrogenase (NADP+)/methenyltetrahydrofolate cyclohydrolase
VNLKEKACADAGICFERHELPATATQDEVITVVQNLNGRPDIDAVLVQMPLPAHIDEDAVILTMDPAKDVDGFHPQTTVVPGLAAGIMTLIQSTKVPLAGKTALVIANSDVVYRPLAKVLAEAELAPSFRKPDEGDVEEVACGADVLIVAVGRADYVHADMVKPGAIIIDVGTNRVDGKVVGDVAEDAWNVAGFITPVPGGVGPITVAILLANVLTLAERRQGGM